MVIHTTLASNNSLRFRENLLERIQNLIMTIDDKINDKTLPHDINGEVAKLSSGKIDKYEYLTGKEILPSDQSRIIEQAKSTYSLLGKAFEKQIKTIEDQGIKEVEALKVLKPEKNWELETSEGLFLENIRCNKITNKLDEIKELEEKIKRKDLMYKTNQYEYDFQQYETIRSFSESIYFAKITTDKAEEDQRNLLKDIIEFNEKSRPRAKEEQDKKRDTYETVYALYEGREIFLNDFRS